MAFEALHMNVFRVLGDVSHTISKCILIWAIHSNKSAEGVSLITQTLYAVVFCSRYLNLFWVPPAEQLWNFVLKIFYITSSFYIIFIMMKVYARTREREKAWKLGAYCLGGSVVLGPIVAALAEGKATTVPKVFHNFSLVLESVCVIPQLLLLRQTTVPTVIDSGYILTLGSYRAFYILNWIVRLVSKEHHFEWPAVLFGIIQTAFYVDFAWVYWTRQRVKLRGGAVVDSDDLSRGFLVRRVLGKGDPGPDEESGDANHGGIGTKPAASSRWGPRGISISADDDEVSPEGMQRPRPGRADIKDAKARDEMDPALKDPEDYEDGLSGLDDDVDEQRNAFSQR